MTRLLALAQQPNLRRCVQPHVADAKVEDLLHTRAGVEHQREQRVVAPAEPGRAVDAAQQRVHLAAFEVLDRGLPRAALERRADDALE